MIVDNSKIRSFGPLEYAPFAGVSAIFDNPTRESNARTGTPLGTQEQRERFAQMECDTSSQGRELYAALKTATREKIGIPHLMEAYKFCPLPPSTFHVTMCDLFNIANVLLLSPPARELATQILDGLPGTLESAQMSSFGFERRSSERPVTFEFKELAVFGDSALVAVLQPAGGDEVAFKSIKQHRLVIDQILVKIGKPPNPPFVPHVSLGYLASTYYAPYVKECLPQWTRLVREEANGSTITFDSASLYGFRDMITFWCGTEIWSAGSAASNGDAKEQSSAAA